MKNLILPFFLISFFVLIGFFLYFLYYPILAALIGIAILGVGVFISEMYPDYKLQSAVSNRKPVSAKLAYKALREGYIIEHESFCKGSYLKLKGHFIYKHFSNHNKIKWTRIDVIPPYLNKGPYSKNYYIIKE
jgi:hypothetical protein